MPDICARDPNQTVIQAIGLWSNWIYVPPPIMTATRIYVNATACRDGDSLAKSKLDIAIFRQALINFRTTDTPLPCII